MAPVYADHPFPLIPTPVYQAGKDAEVSKLLFGNTS